MLFTTGLFFASAPDKIPSHLVCDIKPLTLALESLFREKQVLPDHGSFARPVQDHFALSTVLQ